REESNKRKLLYYKTPISLLFSSVRFRLGKTLQQNCSRNGVKNVYYRKKDWLQPVFNRLFADKLLCPVITFFIITDTDMGEILIQNIRAMTLAIHPSVDDFGRSTLSFGNVFTSIGIGNSPILHHLKWRAICRTVMGKIII